MTDKRARILKFVLERKKSVTAKCIAKQFCIAQSTAATHLRELHYAGHISRETAGKEILWGKKPATQDEAPPVPMAVSSDVVVRRAPEPKPEPEVVQVRPHRSTPVDWEPPKPIWPDNPFKTSYPHVRGYDD